MPDHPTLALPAAAARQSATDEASASLRGMVMLLVGLLSIGLAMWLVLPHITAKAQLADGQQTSPYPPWILGGGHGGSAGNRFELDLRASWLTPARWDAAYQGRLQHFLINGQEVMPGPLPASNLWQKIQLTYPLWRHGLNHIEFVLDVDPGTAVSPYVSVGGVSFQPVLGWRLLLLAAGFLPWLAGLGSLFRLQRQQILALAVAVLVLCIYWEHTPWNQRTQDVIGESGHLGYVVYVANHLALPPPNQGWTFFHPPLYYIVAAVVWRLTPWLGLSGPVVLQGLALTLWLVFLTPSAGALRLCLRRSLQVLLLATIALALWPSGIFHGLRLGNDAALYAAAGPATWFLLRWWRSGRRRHLFAAAGFTALALLCKSNAIVLATALGMLVGLRLLLRPRQRYPRQWLDAGVAAGVIGAGMLLSLANQFYYYWHGQLDSWLVGNAFHLAPVMRVPVKIDNFLPLHLPLFLSTPWMSSFDDASGRANFWNYLLRSAISGEYHFEGALQHGISLVWGGLLLMLLLALLVPGRRRWSRAALWRDAPLLLLGLLWFASVLALRIDMPYSCSNDFRYILPVLLPFVIAAARRNWASRVLLLMIALGSPVFVGTL